LNKIQTVSGSVDAKNIGIILPHEHVICDSRLCRSFQKHPTPPWGSYMFLDDPIIMSEELRIFRENGGGCVVDVTCHGWGRDPIALKEISKRSAVQIVACTGLYVEDCMPSWVTKSSVEQLGKWIIREITVGCNEKQGNRVTNIKAGVIKTSFSRPVFSHNELKGLIAAAYAHSETGVPITTHNSGSIRFELEGGNIGLKLLDYLEAEDVNPNSVIIGHTDENPDKRNLTELLERGAWIQFDTIGKQHYILDDTRGELLQKLCENGFLNQLLISQDRNRKPMLCHYGGPGYSDILNRFTPLLRKIGFSEKKIRKLLIENPRRALGIKRR
jgi:phosphotriesterase-related protein